MGNCEDVTIDMDYNKLQHLQKKMDEIEFLLESEHIYAVTDKNAIEKLKKIDEASAHGKRKTISETEFFCKY